MATVEQVLTLARKELGYRESPANSNRTKYGDWYGLDGEPWCMMFIMWLFHQAEASGLLPARTASCGNFMAAAKKAGNWLDASDLQPGDIVVFDFPGNRSKTDHVGIVEEPADENGFVTTIEGNTSVGDDADGGMVMRRKRKPSLIAGAFRPAYDAPEAAPTAPAPDDLDTEAALYGGSRTETAETEQMRREEAETVSESVPGVGGLVMFTGESQFSGSYDDAEAVPATTCMARVEDYCPGAAHPFRLYGKGLEGWADLGDVTPISPDGAVPAQNFPETLFLG